MRAGSPSLGMRLPHEPDTPRVPPAALYPRPMTEWLAALEWGDVPTWFSALGGIGALIAATAARASLDVLRIESQRDQDADERAQRAQADLVAAWLETEDATDMGAWYIRVVNASQIPVYELDIQTVSSFSWPDDEGFNARYLAVAPPGETHIPIEDLLNHIGRHLPLTEWGMLRNTVGVHASHDVWITFRDAAGGEWIRSATGTLRRKPPGLFIAPDHSMTLRENEST